MFFWCVFPIWFFCIKNWSGMWPHVIVPGILNASRGELLKPGSPVCCDYWSKSCQRVESNPYPRGSWAREWPKWRRIKQKNEGMFLSDILQLIVVLQDERPLTLIGKVSILHIAKYIFEAAKHSFSEKQTYFAFPEWWINGRNLGVYKWLTKLY